MFDERVDARIDEVAREMTQGELPPDFRARVIARLERGDERRRTWTPSWVLAPLAVVGAVLLAVLVVRAPWRSGTEIPDTARARAGDVRQQPTVRPTPDVTDEALASHPGDADSRAAVTSFVSGSSPTERSPLSDLAPAPIHIESLDVEAMESMDITPLSVDAMESIDVPGLDMAPLEVAAIAE